MATELVILVDNRAVTADLVTEHGLAILIRGPGGKVLFDAGLTAHALLRNAEVLGVEVSSIDAAVVSHGHYDHTGGLAAVAERRRGLKLYAHPGVFARRWAEKPGQTLRDVSCPHSLARLIRAGATFCPTEAPQMVEGWLLLSGPIGGPKGAEEDFIIRKGDQMLIDGFEDEMFCMVRGKSGWAVITGCCHRGLKNTLRSAKFLAHDEPIAAIVGGLHLRSTPQAGMQGIVELLKAFGEPAVHACHCTGDAAAAYLAERLPGKVHPVGAGSRIEV